MPHEQISTKRGKSATSFRWRGGEISRIEGFSDAVFAFAVTLLVVSLEVPETFSELLTSFLYGLLLIAYHHLAVVSFASQKASEFISSSIAGLFTQRQLFGTTAFGLPILMLFVIFILSAYVFTKPSLPRPQQVNEAKNRKPFRFCNDLFVRNSCFLGSPATTGCSIFV
jgi:hypothetical protein